MVSFLVVGTWKRRTIENWTPVLSACIKGKNNKILTTNTIDECKHACETELGFQCLSIDYKGTECHLSTYNKLSAGREYSQPCYISGFQYAELSQGRTIENWTLVLSACIKGKNNKILKTNTIDECKHACETELGFQCLITKGRNVISQLTTNSQLAMNTLSHAI